MTLSPTPATLPILFDAMTLGDLPAVLALEEVCFPQPWTESMYRYELTENRYCAYWVVRPNPAQMNRDPDGMTTPSLLAYGGYWIMGEEAHIVTIATHPAWRRRRLGMWLFLQMCARLRRSQVQSITLEVRKENLSAIQLYASLGFEEVGERRNYYGRGQDALIMTLADVDQETVGSRLQAALVETEQRLAQTLLIPSITSS